MRRRSWVLWLLVLHAACDATSTAAPDAGACGDGLQAIGSACVPIFDDCASDEVPLRGGGCRRVGVRECDGGIAGPPDWTCKRIGVQECDGGLRGPPDWTCKAIGPPTTCLAGWERVEGGWCEPKLPKGTCPEGTMEVLGQKTCQPVGDCGTGTWGKIVPTPTTVFVDGKYPGSDSDGSKAKPFTTIGKALLAGTQVNVAVAAGTYKEDLDILVTGATVAGRCAQMVTIFGQSSSSPAVNIAAGQVKLRGVTVTGPGEGIGIGGTKVVLDRVAARGCGKSGVVLRTGSEATVTNSVVAGNRQAGVLVGLGAEAGLQGCVVRDTLPDAVTGKLGHGVSTSSSSSLSLRDCLLSDNTRTGLQAVGAKVTVESSVVRRTRAAKADLTGRAIHAVYDPSSKTPSKLTARDSLVAENPVGVWADSSEATIERSVIRDSKAPGAGIKAGVGVVAVPRDSKSPLSKLTLRQSIVTGTVTNVETGSAVSVNSSRAVIESTVIRDTRHLAAGVMLAGIGITSGALAGDPRHPSLEVRSCLLRDNSTVGVYLVSADAKISRTVVRGTRSIPMTRTYGQGIQATSAIGRKRPAEVTIEDSLIERNDDVGIVMQAGDVKLVRSVVKDNMPPPTSRPNAGYGIYAGADPTELVPSKLTVQECLVAGNHQAGIVVNSSDATIKRTISRDNRPVTSMQMAGYGMYLGQQLLARVPVVSVLDCLFARNRHLGVGVEGGQLKMERTVIRDTRAVAGKFGKGIQAMYMQQKKRASTVSVSDSVLDGNHADGIGIWGASATIKRVAVRGVKGGSPGIGVVATTYITSAGPRIPSKLTLADSRITGSGNAGVLVYAGSSAAVSACEVRETRGNEGSLGDGLVVLDKGTSLSLTDSLVEGSRRIGLLVQTAGGSARRSVFRRGVFPVYLDRGAPFSVADDNVYVDNKENRVTFGSGYRPSKLPDKPPSFFK